MKGFLFAGIIVMLTVAAVESLSCVQCNSLTDPCFDGNAIECPANASISCTTFLTNFSLGENITWYEDKACSADNCSVAETFTVHVSANETFHFASQCCQGKACNDTNDTIDPPQEEVSSNTGCSACYGSSETSCNETTRKCYKEERCVSLIAEFKNGSGRTGPATTAHGPSRSAARGIFPDRSTNPCPLHRQADSQPLRHL
ncbi:ly6/PLAUR domain-containing protein 8 isoform X2 [Pseudorca crassidens]|uniref:ly6/PLAUR domain-containing protein 8 isoform X2 n=1 Tax=Pseudorca crassidens TaxID=82174 RepID=UPI00352F9E94